MMKYLKKFATDNNRLSYEDSEDYIEPYVSLVEENNSVHYNKVETKLVVYYDIQDISAPTTIFTNYDSSVKSIEVDGTLLDSVVTTYQFDSVGEHVIKFEFNNPTTVGNNAPLFDNLTTVKRIVIPNTFTAIGSNAFSYCSNLTSITIPNSVTSIGSNAFGRCSGLTSVTIPNSVTSIGDAVFSYCSGLTSITIPDNVISIGQGAFQGCSSLTNVIIGNNVTSIGNNAFYLCSGLTSITIPNSVTSIGDYAFQSCISLTSVTSLATTAPTIQNTTFLSVKTNGTLTVPSGSSGYDVWMGTGNFYLGKYNWTKVEQ